MSGVPVFTCPVSAFTEGSTGDDDPVVEIGVDRNAMVLGSGGRSPVVAGLLSWGSSWPLPMSGNLWAGAHNILLNEYVRPHDALAGTGLMRATTMFGGHPLFFGL